MGECPRRGGICPIFTQFSSTRLLVIETVGHVCGAYSIVDSALSTLHGLYSSPNRYATVHTGAPVIGLFTIGHNPIAFMHVWCIGLAMDKPTHIKLFFGLACERQSPLNPLFVQYFDRNACICTETISIRQVLSIRRSEVVCWTMEIGCRRRFSRLLGDVVTLLIFVESWRTWERRAICCSLPYLWQQTLRLNWKIIYGVSPKNRTATINMT